MRKLLCKILTRGKHLFRLREHRYRCLFCKALRYQVEPRPAMKEGIVPRLPDKIEAPDTGTGLPPEDVEKYTNDEPVVQN